METFAFHKHYNRIILFFKQQQFSLQKTQRKEPGIGKQDKLIILYPIFIENPILLCTFLLYSSEGNMMSFITCACAGFDCYLAEKQP